LKQYNSSKKKESSILNLNKTNDYSDRGVELILSGGKRKLKKSFEVNLTIKVKDIDRIYFIKSIFIENNSLFDQIIIFNDYTDLISAEKNNAIADLARKISHEIKNTQNSVLLFNND